MKFITNNKKPEGMFKVTVEQAVDRKSVYIKLNGKSVGYFIAEQKKFVIDTKKLKEMEIDTKINWGLF